MNAPDRRYVLECPHCREPIALPNGKPQGKLVVPPYWPKAGDALITLCPTCGYLSSHSEREIRQSDAGGVVTERYPSIFWKAVLVCEHDNCGREFTVHTRTGPYTTTSAVGLCVLHARPALTCPQGHKILNPQTLSVHRIVEGAEERKVGK